MVSWTCQRVVLNWPTLRSGGVFRLRGTTAISQQARAVEGLLGNMSSRSILEGGCRGKVLPRCIFGLPATARLCHGAFPGARRWQNARAVRPPSIWRWRDCALMRSWPDWQWQYSRAVRSRGSCRGKIPPRCVPGHQSVASFALHASRKRPRTGKSPVRGKILAPCIRKRAGSGRICAPCIRKAPQTAFRERTARRSCQEGGAFRCTGPSNHARRANLAIVQRMKGKDQAENAYVL